MGIAAMFRRPMMLKNNPFYFLLGGLLIALLVTPIVSERFPGYGGSLMTITLLLSVLSLSASKHIYRAAWLLIVAKIVLMGVAYVNPVLGTFIAEVVVMLMFFFLATVFSFRRVLENRHSDMNRIAGAISIYMLIGLMWTSLYFFLSLMDSQAFKGLPDLISYDARHLETVYMDLTYFSYVTLSTLGYGDITPASRAAQSLAYLEAISGVMYVAVLVASLVGTYGKKPPTQA